MFKTGDTVEECIKKAESPYDFLGCVFLDPGGAKLVCAQVGHGMFALITVRGNRYSDPVDIDKDETYSKDERALRELFRGFPEARYFDTLENMLTPVRYQYVER